MAKDLLFNLPPHRSTSGTVLIELKYNHKEQEGGAADAG